MKIEEGVAPTWEQVDLALRSIAERRAGLDAEEARWLREAELLQVWRPLGMVSIFDYMERVLGYAPHTAQERLRVARALGELPHTETALERGALSFSAVRELTRVVTPDTEAEWLESVTEKNLRQIEDAVAFHKKGDKPDEPGDPQIRDCVLRLVLKPEAYAALREARRALEDEHGGRLDDSQLVTALAGLVLGGNKDRAQHQIAVTVCEQCKQGWQTGAGANLPVSAAAVERATCDAEHIGSIDAEKPERAHLDIPPATRRLVWARDRGRCRVPVCRSTRGLDIHHLEHQEHGGTHEPSNLALACSSCHIAHHEGRITIRGPADAITVERSHDYEVAVASSADLPIEGSVPRSCSAFRPLECRAVSIDYSRSWWRTCGSPSTAPQSWARSRACAGSRGHPRSPSLDN